MLAQRYCLQRKPLQIQAILEGVSDFRRHVIVSPSLKNAQISREIKTTQSVVVYFISFSCK